MRYGIHKDEIFSGAQHTVTPVVRIRRKTFYKYRTEVLREISRISRYFGLHETYLVYQEMILRFCADSDVKVLCNLLEQFKVTVRKFVGEDRMNKVLEDLQTLKDLGWE